MNFKELEKKVVDACENLTEEGIKEMTRAAGQLDMDDDDVESHLEEMFTHWGIFGELTDSQCDDIWNKFKKAYDEADKGTQPLSNYHGL